MENPNEIKSFKCGICGGICSDVSCKKCNKIICMLHRTKIKNGFICDKCKKDDENVRLLYR